MTACLDADGESAKPESQNVGCNGCFESFCPNIQLMAVCCVKPVFIATVSLL